MTDFAGSRLVCYLLSDTEIISGVIRYNFEILKRDDKTNGYKAIHRHTTSKQERTVLPEYERYTLFRKLIELTLKMWTVVSSMNDTFRIQTVIIIRRRNSPKPLWSKDQSATATAPYSLLSVPIWR